MLTEHKQACKSPRPLLSLSRVGARKKLKRTTISKVVKPATSCPPTQRASPQFRVPIPSSFVDTTSLNEREKAFLASSDEESEFGAKRRPDEKPMKARLKKDEMRQKLKEAKKQLMTRLHESDPGDKITSEPSEQRNRPYANANGGNTPVAEQTATSSKVANAQGSESKLDESCLRTAVNEVFCSVDNFDEVTVRQVLDQVATKLNRKALTRMEKSLVKERLQYLLQYWQCEIETLHNRSNRIVSQALVQVKATATEKDCGIEEACFRLLRKQFAAPIPKNARRLLADELRQLLTSSHELIEKENKKRTAESSTQLLNNAAKEVSLHFNARLQSKQKTTTTAKPKYSPSTKMCGSAIANSEASHDLSSTREQLPDQQSERPESAKKVTQADSKCSEKLNANISRTDQLLRRPQSRKKITQANKECAEKLDSNMTPNEQPLPNIPAEQPKSTKIVDQAKCAENIDGNTSSTELPLSNQPSARPKSKKRVTQANNNCVEKFAVKNSPSGKNCKLEPKGTTTETKLSPKKTKRVTTRAVRCCALCQKCPCRNQQLSSTVASVGELNPTNGAIEKALIKRLAKMETVADQYEEQTEMVRRKLKKHRRDMWKKREDLLQRATKKIAEKRGGYFLPDAEELDGHFATRKRRKHRPESAAKATSKLFNTKLPANQTTLTQMVNPEKPSMDEDSVPSEVSCKDDALESDIDEDSTVADDEAELTELDVPVQRLFPVTNQSKCLWHGVQVGSYSTTWDNLFNEDLCEDDEGVEQLLGMMTSSPTKQQPQTRSQQTSPSALSVRAQQLTEEITEQTLSDKTNLVAIENLCPQWKENVVFAMAQREATDISHAIDNVREEQDRLGVIRDKFMEALDKRTALLQFYQKTLEISASRLGDSADKAPRQKSEI